MSEVTTISLNSILPDGEEFTPVFENAEDYREFRERYVKAMRPELEQQSEARRKSEEEARRRLLG